MIQASLRIVAPPGKRAEVLDVLRSLRGPTEVARGCQGCWVMQDADSGDAFQYLVLWDSLGGLEQYFRGEQFRRLLPYIELSVEPPQVDVNALRHVGGIEFLVAALGGKTA